MDKHKIVGLVATSATIAYTLLGLPAQLLQNYRTQSVGGASLLMAILLVCSFGSWAVYAIVKRDWYILIPNSLGTICSSLFLLQFYLYS